MRKRYFITSLVCIAIAAITTLAMWGQTSATSLKRGDQRSQDTTPKIALAYMVDRYDVLPDPEMFSHLIYAFGVFNDNYDGVVIRYPDKLKSMTTLKEKNPE